MIPREIRELREAYGLTQAAMARALGVTPQTIWFWEKGRYAPGPYEHMVLLRLRQMLEEKGTREVALGALRHAQGLPTKPDPIVPAKELLKTGLFAFGIGFLLGALFGQDKQKKKN